MALARAVAPSKVTLGHAKPRIAPPVPARSGVKEFAAFSDSIGLTLRPWQETAGRYLSAEGADGRWLYREVAIIASRQNGKTTILVPHICARLLAGRRIMHTAQNRELPREVFGMVADIMQDRFSKELKSRPRFANGQEEIRLRNGGHYRIVAPTRGGARGPSNDDVIIDELREMESNDFIGAAKPTLTASAKPQIVYFSNAGTEESTVLNALRLRGPLDPALAYLEWSADPKRDPDDVAGWAESNPSMGHDPAVLLTLQDEYRAHKLAGTMAIFETEHLCRWVVTIRERLVDDPAWEACHGELVTPRRPFLGVSMDPSGSRASAAIAWQQDDGTIGLRLLFHVSGNPIDVAALGKDIHDTALRMGATKVGYDPYTDAELAKHFKKPEPIAGQKYANASATFVNAVNGRRLRWDDAQQVSDDLAWTARKAHDESGSFQAVRANDDRPITAVLAAIRAVSLAAGPTLVKPRVY